MENVVHASGRVMGGGVSCEVLLYLEFDLHLDHAIMQEGW